MKKALLILLSIMILTGCTNSNSIQNADSTSDSGSSEASCEDQTDQNAGAQAKGEEILTIWKRDVTLQDEWVPSQDLSSFPARELSVAASESVPVIISANSREI